MERKPIRPEKKLESIVSASTKQIASTGLAANYKTLMVSSPINSDGEDVPEKPYFLSKGRRPARAFKPTGSQSRSNAQSDPTISLSSPTGKQLLPSRTEEFANGNETASLHLTDHLSPEKKKAAHKKILRNALLVCYFVGIMKVYTNRVKIYGAIRKLDHLKKIAQEKAKPKISKKCLPLQPRSIVKLIWNLIILGFLLILALATPFRIAFVDLDSTPWVNLDYVFCCIFFVDIVISFVSVHVDDKTQAVYEDFATIAKKYVVPYFFIDLIALIPFDAISSNSPNTLDLTTRYCYKLLMLLRLPKLYRLFQIFKAIKYLGFGNSRQKVSKIFKRLNLNIGLFRMLRVLMNVFFLTHLVACLWFFSAKINNFDPSTWVYKAKLVDDSSMTQYVAAFYWTIQTLTTVGYGDIPPENLAEWIISSIWMLIGIAFYSFAVGYLSTILTNFGQGSSLFQSNMNAFHGFAMKVDLPDYLRLKIQKYLEVNHRENIYNWFDPRELLKELPSNLRTQLILFTYAKMIRNIRLLCIDANFTATICPSLKLVRFQADEIIYREDDPAVEIYFIAKGQIALIDEYCNEIAKISAGSFFGELEILQGVKRKCYVKSIEESKIVFCDKEVFLETLKEFPAIEDELKSIAERRREAFFEKRKPSPEPSQNAIKLLRSTEYFAHAHQVLYKSRQPLFVKPHFLPTGNINRLQTKIEPTKKSAFHGIFGKGENIPNPKSVLPPNASYNALEDAQLRYLSPPGSDRSSGSEGEFKSSDFVEKMMHHKNAIAATLHDMPQKKIKRETSGRATLLEILDQEYRRESQVSFPQIPPSFRGQQGQGSSKPVEETKESEQDLLNRIPRFLRPTTGQMRTKMMEQDPNQITEQDDEPDSAALVRSKKRNLLREPSLL